MKLSEKEKSAEVQKHPLIMFEVDEPVRMKQEHVPTNGVRIKGRVNGIRIDRNGIWYEVLYNPIENGVCFKSADFLAFLLEKDI